MATLGARLALIVLTSIYDLGFGQIFNACYPLGVTGFILSWAIHSRILSNKSCLEEISAIMAKKIGLSPVTLAQSQDIPCTILYKHRDLAMDLFLHLKTYASNQYCF